MTFLKEAFGLTSHTLILLFSMVLRGIIIYFVGISLARFNKKLMGIRTPFNFILVVMLGSIFAGAIMDANWFIPIISTILVLTLLNGLMTMLAFYVPAIELFVKGAPSILVKDGTIQWDAMKKNFITENELLNELHTQMHTHDLNGIESAILASDGTINFIRK